MSKKLMDFFDAVLTDRPPVWNSLRLSWNSSSSSDESRSWNYDIERSLDNFVDCMFKYLRTFKSITTGLVISGSIMSKLALSHSKSSSSLLVSGVGSLSNLNDMWRGSKLLCFRPWNDLLWLSNSSSEDWAPEPFSKVPSSFEDLTSSETCFFDWYADLSSPSR